MPASLRARAGGFDASPITRICTPAAGSSCSASALAAATTPYATVLAIDVNGTVALQPSQLLPALVAGDGAVPVVGYVAVPWAQGFSAVASACAAGAPASGCLTPFSAATPLALHTGVPEHNYTHAFELWSLAPRYESGWGLVGELGKVVRVSPARFAFVAPSGDGLTFGVVGAAGEAVHVSVLAPAGAGAGGQQASSQASVVAGSMLEVEISIPASGSLTVSCSGAGATAACG